MYELKTKETGESVIAFIEAIENERKKADAYRLLDIFTEVSGYKAKMWGPTMIGFGSYRYTYPTGHSGEYFLVGFSPRKAKISLYFATGDHERERLLADFGKHTTGKSCVYVNKVDDIDIDVLKELIRQSILFLQAAYPDQGE
ncbi:MAG: DUF1801 domain-containing protein [Paenibacillus sp.]|uniref:YdhG-like domain-containing protein n=1 Tax=Paenibacillus aquistagni TaxID=1852522 RepID=A0A1X7ILK1_9BACL|nr:DUF1801 domain-containing protein [Paenibacillus aquistagni]MBR2568549.1 DUF1801 domain-containing protein [Paenibacillus sp.]NMM51283.1 DUF1801 domain-containing protein [Paenibacillus aquistagni]SMG15714.1 protein of unknown function (DU1801) [Paenibacillus aquistagni]